jgi:type VI secretion system secreted protein VgrG
MRACEKVLLHTGSKKEYPMAVSQQNRLIRIATPLGDDIFVVLSFSGSEEISDLFGFELQLASERDDISFEQLAGENVSVSVRAFDGTKRFFNGIIIEFEPDDTSSKEGFSTYHARMVPAAWLLKHCRDIRIFQDKSVPDIIKAVLDRTSLGPKGVRQVIDFRTQLSGAYAARPYCVQYNESDYNFICRLCEDEGISFFFEHARGGHTMVFADDSAGYKPFAAGSKANLRFQEAVGGVTDQEVITSLRAANRLTTGRYVARDYNFTIPENDMTVQKDSLITNCKGQGETYEYPGGYEKTNGRGESLAKVRMQAMDARSLTLRGSSDCRGFIPGSKFGLNDHSRKSLNGKEYLLLKVRHKAQQHFASDSTGDNYSNNFLCMPVEIPFRPERNTLKPAIAGSQTAIVTGPAGEEIHTDDHGRVKVKFPWDRNPDNKADENLTCWIRVSQAWAGSSYGAVHIPRIGQEVIVNFLEGDPDRPIITGRVYHGKNLPPYDLPADKTKSTIMSNSSKNGAGNSNEIMFEDLKGSENFFTHAAKDRNEVVENDKSTQVKNIQTIEVKKDRLVTVAEGNEIVAVRSGGRDITVKSAEKHTNAADFNHQVSGSYTLKVNGNITIDASGFVKIMGAKVIINP